MNPPLVMTVPTNVVVVERLSRPASTVGPPMDEPLPTGAARLAGTPLVVDAAAGEGQGSGEEQSCGTGPPRGGE